MFTIPRGLKETRHQVFMCGNELPSQIADNRPVARTCHRPPPVNRQLDVSCYASLVYRAQRFSLWLWKGLFQMFVIKNMFFPEAVSANKNQSFVKTIVGHTRDGSFMPVPGSHTRTNAFIRPVFTCFSPLLQGPQCWQAFRQPSWFEVMPLISGFRGTSMFSLIINHTGNLAWFSWCGIRKLLSSCSRPTVANV